MHFGASRPDKPDGVSHTPAQLKPAAAATVPPPVAGGGAAKSVAPHAPPVLPPPSPAPLLPPGPNSVSARTQDVAKEDLKAKPPLTGAFDSLAPPRGDESMLDVCADFIADARAGLKGMRPKELCSACEMCDDHGRDMKLYQETQPGAVPSRLSCALVAVLGLYTAQLAGVSPYSGCNEALRSADRSKCKPYVKFIWFLMHAMAKCDPYDGSQVFRGVKRRSRGSSSAAARATSKWSRTSSSAAAKARYPLQHRAHHWQSARHHQVLPLSQRGRGAPPPQLPLQSYGPA